eukprot:CAMPEP_0117655928 /NCGR_PEP_ID=MMETSP0804-20121206/4535_1 /TAXON_ID=1074897 /ORGANISM="Tetraselmis astigmatica, Strain CCMP880" /LENGTH=99 /DNA_ID=CAMNT_0005462301 /DNA_START=879 /DNA_END=1175 /DNA_ORIENTATION=-
MTNRSSAASSTDATALLDTAAHLFGAAAQCVRPVRTPFPKKAAKHKNLFGDGPAVKRSAVGLSCLDFTDVAVLSAERACCRESAITSRLNKEAKWMQRE